MAIKVRDWSIFFGRELMTSQFLHFTLPFFFRLLAHNRLIYALLLVSHVFHCNYRTESHLAFRLLMVLNNWPALHIVECDRTMYCFFWQPTSFFTSPKITQIVQRLPKPRKISAMILCRNADKVVNQKYVTQKDRVG